MERPNESQDQARRRFVWRYGVFGFGAGMAALSTAHDAWLLVSSPGGHWLTPVLQAILNVLFFGLAGGYVWGRVMWALFSARRSR